MYSNCLTTYYELNVLFISFQNDNGNNTHSTILCGDNSMDLKNINYVSRTSHVTIKFESDFSVQCKGFSAQVIFIVFCDASAALESSQNFAKVAFFYLSWELPYDKSQKQQRIVIERTIRCHRKNYKKNTSDYQRSTTISILPRLFIILIISLDSM